MGTKYSPILKDVLSKSCIDKETLYGEFLKSVRRKGRVEDLAIAKALDIPMDDDVQINQSKTGITGWPLVSLLLGGGGLSAWLISSLASSPLPSLVPSPSQGVDAPAVQVEMFYRDPEKGLIPIPGAADPAGGAVP